MSDSHTADAPRVFCFSKLVLGDSGTSSRFSDATFVGLRLALPIRVYLIDEPAPPRISLIFKTSAIETWADWQRHTVKLGGVEIGYLGDSDQPQAPSEIHTLSLRTADLRALLHTGKPLILEISVGTRDPGMADDFLLKEIASVGAVFVLGW